MNVAITLNISQEFKDKLQFLADNDSRKLSSFCKVQLEKLVEGIEIPKSKPLCEPCVFSLVSFTTNEVVNEPRIKFKKFICAICPYCKAFTFDLNTEIMQGSCLSCCFKSEDYKGDMIKYRGKGKQPPQPA